MVYVALLRGINVGGKCKVEMSRLKDLFEHLGYTKIKTYINSGNVIFEDNRLASEQHDLITVAIEKEFGFSVPVILRTHKEIEELCKSIPLEWTNDVAQKTDVMFLWDEIDSVEILEKVAHKPEIENVLYLPGALVWNIGRQNVTKGSGIKLIKTNLYKHMTVRNINTVRKLQKLLV
jgi:uncharacterized protein (DUF1697 family)